MSLKKKIVNNFNKNISLNTKLSNYSWFNLGGPAEYFFKPQNKSELLDFLKENKKDNFKITVLGAGSNTLIRDKGIKGVVIKLGQGFSDVNLIDKTTINAGAACLDKRVSNFAKDNGIGNFEFLSCIPGSIGGAVIMNTGCYSYDISKIFVSLTAIDINKCEEREIKRENIQFHYRGTDLPDNLIVTSVKLKGKQELKEIIENKQNSFIEKKKLSQPSQVKTCGSTFKNLNENQKAWKIIKESGCDNFEVGDANISKKHCNFFVNNGNAKSSDIEKLINKVREKVLEKKGINLELEIKIIGEK